MMMMMKNNLSTKDPAVPEPFSAIGKNLLRICAGSMAVNLPAKIQIAECPTLFFLFFFVLTASFCHFLIRRFKNEGVGQMRGQKVFSRTLPRGICLFKNKQVCERDGCSLERQDRFVPPKREAHEKKSPNVAKLSEAQKAKTTQSDFGLASPSFHIHSFNPLHPSLSLHFFIIALSHTLLLNHTHPENEITTLPIHSHSQPKSQVARTSQAIPHFTRPCTTLFGGSSLQQSSPSFATLHATTHNGKQTG